MDASVKAVLQPLLIGIMNTAVGSALFVLSDFLWKFMMEYWCGHAREPSPPGTAVVESGDQRLPPADAFSDVEMGPMNSGEAEDHPSGVAANRGVDLHHESAGMQNGNMIPGESEAYAPNPAIKDLSVSLPAHQPLTDANATEVKTEIL